MKRNPFAVAAVFGALMGAVASAQAADGTITITGEVTAQTCNVTPIGGAAGNNIEVDVGTHSQDSLSVEGSFTTEKKFGFNLQGDGCQDGNVSFTWLGANIVPETGALANTEAGGTSAQAQLVNDQGEAINLLTGANSPEIAVPAAGGVDVYLGARLYTPEGSASAGLFSSSVEFTVTQL